MWQQVGDIKQKGRHEAGLSVETIRDDQ